MSQADALLLPSLRDDAPLTIAEAQVLGVPVVAFDRGGAREFARHAGASVVAVTLAGRFPEQAFAEGVQRSLLMPRGPCAEPYGEDSIVRFLATAYRTAVGRAESPAPIGLAS
jgi:glycosyltransferase involved in cell wall biosynthesis